MIIGALIWKTMMKANMEISDSIEAMKYEVQNRIKTSPPFIVRTKRPIYTLQTKSPYKTYFSKEMATTYFFNIFKIG